MGAVKSLLMDALEARTVLRAFHPCRTCNGTGRVTVHNEIVASPEGDYVIPSRTGRKVECVVCAGRGGYHDTTDDGLDTTDDGLPF